MTWGLTEIEHISPSQLKTFTACNRKWWWQKVWGVPGKDNPGAMRGTEVHDELENWLLKGVRPTSQELRHALKHFPPSKSKHVLVERWLTANMHTVSFKGRADVIDLRAYKTRIHNKNAPVLIDLKTTSNLKYALSATELLNDLQMNAYAYNILRSLTPDATEIMFRHVYVEFIKNVSPGVTRPPKIRNVEVTVPREMVENYWNGDIKGTAFELLLVANEEWLESVEPNKSHCNAYGGCPYRKLCKDLK